MADGADGADSAPSKAPVSPAWSEQTSPLFGVTSPIAGVRTVFSQGSDFPRDGKLPAHSRTDLLAESTHPQLLEHLAQEVASQSTGVDELEEAIQSQLQSLSARAPADRRLSDSGAAASPQLSAASASSPLLKTVPLSMGQSLHAPALDPARSAPLSLDVTCILEGRDAGDVPPPVPVVLKRRSSRRESLNPSLRGLATHLVAPLCADQVMVISPTSASQREASPIAGVRGSTRIRKSSLRKPTVGRRISSQVAVPALVHLMGGEWPRAGLVALVAVAWSSGVIGLMCTLAALLGVFVLQRVVARHQASSRKALKDALAEVEELLQLRYIDELTKEALASPSHASSVARRDSGKSSRSSRGSISTLAVSMAETSATSCTGPHPPPASDASPTAAFPYRYLPRAAGKRLRDAWERRGDLYANLKLLLAGAPEKSVEAFPHAVLARIDQEWGRHEAEALARHLVTLKEALVRLPPYLNDDLVFGEPEPATPRNPFRDPSDAAAEAADSNTEALTFTSYIANGPLGSPGVGENLDLFLRPSTHLPRPAAKEEADASKAGSLSLVKSPSGLNFDPVPMTESVGETFTQDLAGMGTFTLESSFNIPHETDTVGGTESTLAEPPPSEPPHGPPLKDSPRGVGQYPSAVSTRPMESPVSNRVEDLADGVEDAALSVAMKGRTELRPARADSVRGIAIQFSTGVPPARSRKSSTVTKPSTTTVSTDAAQQQQQQQQGGSFYTNVEAVVNSSVNSQGFQYDVVSDDSDAEMSPVIPMQASRCTFKGRPRGASPKKTFSGRSLAHHTPPAHPKYDPSPLGSSTKSQSFRRNFSLPAIKKPRGKLGRATSCASPIRAYGSASPMSRAGQSGIFARSNHTSPHDVGSPMKSPVQCAMSPWGSTHASSFPQSTTAGLHRVPSAHITVKKGSLLSLELGILEAFETGQVESTHNFLSMLMCMLLDVVDADENAFIVTLKADGLVVAWNTHRRCVHHSLYACYSALSIHRAFYSQLEDPSVIGWSCSVTTGTMEAGRLGNQRKKGYFVLGVCAEQAHQLNLLSRIVQCPMLLTDAVHDTVKDRIRDRPIDSIAWDANARSEILYELLQPEEEVSQDSKRYLDMWKDAFVLFSNDQYHEALGKLGSLQQHLDELGAEDDQVGLLRQKCLRADLLPSPYARLMTSGWTEFTLPPREEPGQDAPEVGAAAGEGAGEEADVKSLSPEEQGLEGMGTEVESEGKSEELPPRERRASLPDSVASKEQGEKAALPELSITISTTPYEEGRLDQSQHGSGVAITPLTLNKRDHSLSPLGFATPVLGSGEEPRSPEFFRPLRSDRGSVDRSTGSVANGSMRVRPITRPRGQTLKMCSPHRVDRTKSAPLDELRKSIEQARIGSMPRSASRQHSDSDSNSITTVSSDDEDPGPPASFTDTNGRPVKRGDQLLGKGAFGEVWLGMMDDGSLVALKTLRLSPQSPQNRKLGGLRRGRQAPSENESVASMVTEVSVLTKYKDESLVAFISCGVYGGYIVIATEYCPGGSLASVLEAFGTLPLCTVKRYTKDILKGLSYLHAHKVIHRDLKPGNVLLHTDGQCKLADFGTCSLEKDITREKVEGTPSYMAPEASLGSCCMASDVWSLALTVCAMLLGEQPFTWDSLVPQAPHAFLRFLNKVEVAPLPPASPQMNGEALAFVKKTLVVEPEQRTKVDLLFKDPFLV
eukprot:TRINITY_DN3675_c0_g1_i1.p1 TRINITY_DN3675_c0_g1~~TRINITY_DN3675_c0_g1_i1.p1  ORF type:complete len:1696 (+),score=482.84 TRINITY_DN3675_c0_g1_i1:69-5156(+)